MKEKNGTQQLKGMVQWCKRYELGIPIVDSQHKKLISLCNSLYESAKINDRNVQKEHLICALKDCTSYVKEHFATEEELMQKAGYIDFEIHKAQHRNFAKKVLETAKELEEKNFTTALNFVMFLYDWILQHISYDDRQFAPAVIAFIEKDNS